MGLFHSWTREHFSYVSDISYMLAFDMCCSFALTTLGTACNINTTFCSVTYRCGPPDWIYLPIRRLATEMLAATPQVGASLSLHENESLR